MGNTRPVAGISILGDNFRLPSEVRKVLRTLEKIWPVEIINDVRKMQSLLTLASNDLKLSPLHIDKEIDTLESITFASPETDPILETAEDINMRMNRYYRRVDRLVRDMNAVHNSIPANKASSNRRALETTSSLLTKRFTQLESVNQLNDLFKMVNIATDEALELLGLAKDAYSDKVIADFRVAVSESNNVFIPGCLAASTVSAKLSPTFLQKQWKTIAFRSGLEDSFTPCTLSIQGQSEINDDPRIYNQPRISRILALADTALCLMYESVSAYSTILYNLRDHLIANLARSLHNLVNSQIAILKARVDRFYESIEMIDDSGDVSTNYCDSNCDCDDCNPSSEDERVDEE